MKTQTNPHELTNVALPHGFKQKQRQHQMLENM